MSVATTILLGGFLTLLFIILKRYYNVQKFARDHKVPPGPTFYPLIGPLFTLYKMVGVRNTVACKWFKKTYGDFAAFFAGDHYIFFMNDYSLLKEVASSEQYDYRIPQHALTYKSIFKQNADTMEFLDARKLGILFSKDDISLKMRSFTLKTLRKLKFAQKAEMGEILKREIGEFRNGVDEARGANGNRVVLIHYIKWSIFSTMWTYLAGDSFPVTQDDLEKVTNACMTEDEKSGMASTIEWYFPELRDWELIADFPKLVRSHKIVGEFIRRVIKSKRESGTYQYEPRDYIDYFIKEIEDSNNGYFNDKMLSMMCNDLMIAGVVTTANSVCWGCYHVMKNPRVYRKLMDEIDEVVGMSIPDLERDGPKMPYLEAIINEVFRMENVVPCVSRSTNKVTEIKGYHIPANAMVILDFDGPNQDPSLWEKPEMFNPDRFLDENKNIKKFEHFNPFGFGRRKCIGEKSARMSMFYHIINIFQNYDFIAPDDVVRTGGVSPNYVPYEIYMTPREKIEVNKRVQVEVASNTDIPQDILMSKKDVVNGVKYQSILEEFDSSCKSRVP